VDTYAHIAEADEAVQLQLADVLDLRASDPQQQAMLHAYLADVPPTERARVLDVGCGTGWVTRALAARTGVAEVVGIDPSPVFIERARLHALDNDSVSFVIGDARRLPFDAGSFEGVVCHTSLCHIPNPERVLAEAWRVTTGGGWLAVFDGDYATTTVATSDVDPLQACVEATMQALVHDRFLVRRLGPLVRDAGWAVVGARSHGYVETREPRYTLTLVDRGADILMARGRIGAPAVDALKAEARRRVARGEFFGHIAYASVIATRDARHERVLEAPSAVAAPASA
jgi:ubiquinone/menaquinone biosynthesis C-methylase UbiE